MSKRLTEEAERYIEDFISNVEDTDISSVDGERSDTSSSLGGIMKAKTFQCPAMSTPPPPVFMDGVVLPWLRWETCNDATPPIGYMNRTEAPVTPKSFSWDASQVIFGSYASPLQYLIASFAYVVFSFFVISCNIILKFLRNPFYRK